MRASIRKIVSKQILPKQQKGAALLFLLTIIVLGAAFILLTKLNSVSGKIDQDRQTINVLALAKEALIGYALTYSESFPGQPQGYLPCPDTSGDGSANPPCGGVRGRTVMGRLPWVQLGLPAFRDGAGECLWYVLSGSYKNFPKDFLTSDTNGHLIIENAARNITVGKTPASQAIALVISPGSLIGGQNRNYTAANKTECGSSLPADAATQSVNYLETLGDINNALGTDAGAVVGDPGSQAIPPTNVALANVFVDSPIVKNASGVTIFNDAIIAITPEDFSPVYSRMNEWVAQRVKKCLNDYANNNGGKFPWPSILQVTGPDYDDDGGGLRFGRIADILDTTQIDDPAMLPAWRPDSDDNKYTCFKAEWYPNPWAWWWWVQWKEMVFIAIDGDYVPTGTATAATSLLLDGGPLFQPGVVIVSGRRLAGKSRDTIIEKADIDNYLEDNNNPALGSGPGNVPPGDDSFVTTASTPFNDYVVALP
ncbi:MAG: hypothetical protein GXP19_09110 [Gammaproteobacteria bacterium]|nr:hypothetical protein [Gammaproteobacteria bacterium]